MMQTSRNLKKASSDTIDQYRKLNRSNTPRDPLNNIKGQNNIDQFQSQKWSVHTITGLN